MRVSFVSQLCWQHSHGLTERSNCHRAAQGLTSQAELLVCNQKAESLECFCTDPAWKSPENVPVLLSFPALSWGGEYPRGSLVLCLSCPGSTEQVLPSLGAPDGVGIRVWKPQPLRGEALLQHRVNRPYLATCVCL